MPHHLLLPSGMNIKKSFFVRALIISIFIALVAVGLAIQPTAAQDGNRTVIYMFWGDGCPHCALAKPFLEELATKYPGVELRYYEIYHNLENRELFLRMANAKGFEARGVPAIFIGDQYWQGFNTDYIDDEIESVVSACSVVGCKDAGEGIIARNEGVLTEVKVTPLPPTSPSGGENNPVPGGGEVISLPLIGRIDLSHQSLFASTALIAFVDGFNPCSIWVLTMLLALTLNTASRRKVALVGIVFLTVTAGVYALFIAGLFTLFTFISFVGWIQVLVAMIALFFAVVNIKDYFFFKQGLSFTIADDKKPSIAKGMRRIMDPKRSVWGLIGATVMLAGGVSLVEFSCTAGFPVLWSNLLVANNVDTLTFVTLLLVYMVIYQLDELAIFFVAVFTLKASRLEEKHGRILKLVGGMLMLTLAAVMLINPALMNDLGSALVIFIIAFGVTGLLLLVHRTILPRMGIWVGSEDHPIRKKRSPDHRPGD